MPISKMPHFRRRLLLVESDPKLSEFLATALDFAGIDVHSATGAEHATALVAVIQPEIIVTNSVLADASAWLLIEKLRRRYKSMQVWLYAANPGPRDAAWATFAEVDHVFYYGDAHWTLFSAVLERLVAQSKPA